MSSPVAPVEASPARSRPLRLLISCGVFAPHAGGAESLFLDLGAELARRGNDVTVVTRRIPSTDEHEVLEGVRVARLRHPMPYEAIRWNARTAFGSVPVLVKLWRLLRGRRIETVVIGLLDSSVLYLLWLRRIHPFRLVLYLHGGETRDLPEWSPSFRALLLRCLAESDRIVAVSDELAEDAVRRLPSARERIEVIPNGVDTRAIAAAEPESRDRRYMLVVGRLVGGKRVDTVLTAFATRLEDLPEIDLVIAGEGPERPRLEALRTELEIPEDRVHFLGAVPRSRVFGLLRGALFLVSASESEGHSIVALEARAAGRMVLAARSRGLREAVREGVHGALFPVGDADALGRLMVRFSGPAPDREIIEGLLGADEGQVQDIRALAERHLDVIAP